MNNILLWLNLVVALLSGLFFSVKGQSKSLAIIVFCALLSSFLSACEVIPTAPTGPVCVFYAPTKAYSFLKYPPFERCFDGGRAPPELIWVQDGKWDSFFRAKIVEEHYESEKQSN